jgi:hypothetical protein
MRLHLTADTRRKARKEVKAFGFRRTLGAQFASLVAISLIAIAAVGLAAFVLRMHAANSGAEVPTITIAFIAAIFAAQQWREDRASRNETSIDTFYARLNITNERLDSWPAARELLSAGEGYRNMSTDISYEQAMYTYLELDNLEYAMEKYRLGYMTPEQALRSLRTFRSRCESPAFRDLALQCCVPGRGYNPDTANVVSRVCRLFAKSDA